MLFSERLRADHDLSDFSSGNPSLDEWLRGAALVADRSGTGRTYVLVDDPGDVVAYFTLAPHLIRRSEVPARAAHGAPDAIPSVLLARLALHESLHGQGIGGALLAHALGVALEAVRTAGGRLVVVDAIDEDAASFYVHHGFVRVPEDPYRLVIKVSVVARSLSIPWP